MATRLRCVVCRRAFEPDPRCGRRQRCCSRRCSRKHARLRRREYQRGYRAEKEAPAHKREENLQYRARVDWARYIRFWRKADPYRRLALERKRARRYYYLHAEQIRAKAKLRRARKKAIDEARSH